MANHRDDLPATPPSPIARCPGVSRRGFCAAAGLGLIAVGLPACAGDQRIHIGGIDDGGDGGGPQDAGNQDFGGHPPDLAQGGGTCPASDVNAGAASAIAVGGAKHFTDNQNYDLYVCRDSNGLYALSASCTHSGCTVEKQSTKFVCPCHGATFDLNGQQPTYPAPSPLDHYAVCVDGSGTVHVDYNSVVSPSTRV